MYSQVYNGGADLGVPGYTCNHDLSQVITCSQSLSYAPMRWLSAPPRSIIPILNLLGIYNPDCWILILISIVSVSIFLLIADKVAKHYVAEPSDFEDLAIIPFRLGKE